MSLASFLVEMLEDEAVSILEEERRSNCGQLRPNIKLKVVFTVLILGLPGNFFTLWVLVTSKRSSPLICEANLTVVSEKSADKLDSSSMCYEQEERAQNVIAMARFWIEGVLILIVGGFGLIGNVVTLIVLTVRAYGSSSFNTMLRCLISVDTLFVAHALIAWGLFACVDQNEPQWYVASYPLIWHPLKHVLLSSCIFMVVVVAFERHQAICSPLRHRPEASFYTCMALLLALLINLPKFLEFRSVCDAYWTSALNEDWRYVVFSGYHECVVLDLLPLLALAKLNYRIVAAIRASRSWRQLHTNSDLAEDTSRAKENSLRVSNASNNLSKADAAPQRKENRQQERSTRILLAIVLVFLLSHIFGLAIKLFRILVPGHGLQASFRICQAHQRLHIPAALFVLGNIHHLLLVVNSSVNFVIYCCLAKRFRQALLALCCRLP